MPTRSGVLTCTSSPMMAPARATTPERARAKMRWRRPLQLGPRIVVQRGSNPRCKSNPIR